MQASFPALCSILYCSLEFNRLYLLTQGRRLESDIKIFRSIVDIFLKVPGIAGSEVFIARICIYGDPC